MKPDITYYPNKDKKGVWVICGGFDYESKDILVVCQHRPRKSEVNKLTTIWSNNIGYDYISVEQISFISRRKNED